MPSSIRLLGFVSGFSNFGLLTSSEKFMSFVYFLTEVCKEKIATPDRIGELYSALKIPSPQNFGGEIRSLRGYGYLTAVRGPEFHLTLKGKRYIIKKLKEVSPVRKSVRSSLISLKAKFSDAREREFFDEVLDCISVSANRSALVMMWIICIHHLRVYVLNHKLREFNVELGRRRGLRVSNVSSYNDFTDIRDEVFIDMLKVIGVITKDQHKILNSSLGTRNTAAHPNEIEITDSKVESTVEDLVTNILSKF